jgi:hypothetical protein
MYTLVSASVLALDLARHPAGAAVADTVDRVLALSADEVRVLASCYQSTGDEPQRAAARARLLEACAVEPRMAQLMLGVRRVIGSPLPDSADQLPGVAEARTIADVLSETLLGGVADLLAMLSREQPLCRPGLPVAGVQAALDAVTAAWAGRGPNGAHLADAMVLAAPWNAGSPLPPPLPDASYGSAPNAGRELRDLLDHVARMSPEQWQRVEQARFGIERSWSTAMHEASRAAVEADRVLAVARAQLSAARALRLSRRVLTPSGGRGGAMAVVAAVQALCVRDRLDPATAQALLGPWQAAA